MKVENIDKNLILEQKKNPGRKNLPPKDVLDSFKPLNYDTFSSFVAENPDTWHLGYPKPLDTETDPELDSEGYRCRHSRTCRYR